MKKLLLIPVVILLLTGCNKPAETQNVEQPETQQVVTPEEQPEDAMEENTEILYNEDGSIDTSNWKTYTNEEYGFSVKYPDYVYTNIERSDSGVINFSAKSIGGPSINIVYHRDIDMNSFADAKKKKYESVIKNSNIEIFATFDEVVVNNSNVIFHKRNFDSMIGEVYSIFAPVEVGLIEITSEDDQKILDLIYKSFRNN